MITLKVLHFISLLHLGHTKLYSERLLDLTHKSEFLVVVNILCVIPSKFIVPVTD